MPKEKVTLTLDTARLKELRDLVGSRSISAAVDDAVGAHVLRLRHLASVDDWLAELERVYGPIQPETLEWAAQLVERWESSVVSPRRKVRRAG
ncbi:MAG TPA: CopG family transcriptional regulator [Gammaproteobacteria bacterium]|jgi:hypothetical protein|nr:CopG family transcriptional regulator [Gammaproteobacteria bacterium]